VPGVGLGNQFVAVGDQPEGLADSRVVERRFGHVHDQRTPGAALDVFDNHRSVALENRNLVIRDGIDRVDLAAEQGVYPSGVVGKIDHLQLVDEGRPRRRSSQSAQTRCGRLGQSS
jgi:hypothetical protein